MPQQPSPAAGLPAIVVFVDRGAGFWLRPLEPGFRHCFAALRQPDGVWVICDPLKDRIELAAVRPDDDGDLARTWHEAGHRVCVGRSRTYRAPGRRPPFPGPLTCVAVVKRLLGLRAPRVITPYQLHRHLITASEQRFVSWP